MADINLFAPMPSPWNPRHVRAARRSRGIRPAYEAHHERVFRLACRLTGRADEADGVTQDTFVQAYCSLRQFKGRSRFMTWLYSIAVRKALDPRRERQSGRETLPLADPRRLRVLGERPVWRRCARRSSRGS